MLKVFRRFVIISFVSAILTMAVFVSFNTPKVVKADVIAGVALGAGCLAALLASSFAVAGVQITNSGGSESYVEGWYNDIVNTYKQADADHKAIVETYFDDQGRYIGTEDELQFVLSDQAYGYWQMGKGVNSLMEDIKQWFVNTFSVSSTPAVLNSQNSLVDDNGFSIPIFQRDGSTIYNTSVTQGIFSIPLTSGDSFSFVRGNNSFGISLTQDGRLVYAYSYVDGSLYSQTPYNTYYGNVNNSNIFLDQTYKFYWYQTSGSDMYWGSSVLNVSSFMDALQSMSLEGSLTDGYQDYQDALNQDLANEQDNDQAVVQVGVGELPGVLTGEQVVADLLEQATANTLEGTYEGVYENQEEATEDKEGEKEFTSEVPEGWVVVNGLEDFFPFCIPYDFYALVSFFDATPEAPKFEFDIELGGVLGTHHVELDFSAFDTVARIFRITVVIGFIVFLVLATRSRFVRG